MTFYRFKTYKSTFYFPPLTPSTRFIYSLYGNYGGRFAHAFWWVFCHVTFVRWLFRVDEISMGTMSLLRSVLGEDAVFGVNMGTQGPDQKISVLGYHSDSEHSSAFFAKLSTTQRSKALSRNEITVYQQLWDTGLVPILYDYQDTDDFVFLKCECLCGNHVHGEVHRQELMQILNVLRNKHYEAHPDASYLSASTAEKKLKTCFAHMDFCPWNMLSFNGKLRLIDWEMAAEKPLGFDLFTYLLQTHFLTENTMTGMEVIEKNLSWINEYFEGEDWSPYLRAFVDYKLDYFSVGQNQLLLYRFLEMSFALNESHPIN